MSKPVICNKCAHRGIQNVFTGEAFCVHPNVLFRCPTTGRLWSDSMTTDFHRNMCGDCPDYEPYVPLKLSLLERLVVWLTDGGEIRAPVPVQDPEVQEKWEFQIKPKTKNGWMI